MTFTEAAVEVLRREGKPLHFRKITEIAVRENLLDHVGKIPEEVMADQVTAHCRLPKPERLLMPVLPATFALVEWQLDEDPTGLENLVDPPPLDELPYRGRERHPIPARDMARVSGRGGDKPRRREEGEEKRSRRFPPPAEVAYEILASSGGAMRLGEIAAHGAERQLMPDAFGRDHAALASALNEDNRRRESAGRRPLFQIDDETVTLVSQPEPGERPAAAATGVRPATPSELRKSGLSALRRRLRECDPATVEHLVLKLLERLGYREVKVARRGKDHLLVTARKRMGLVDIRHGVRVLRSGGDAARRDVAETRRDLGHYGAQIGAIVTSGEAQREARSDAAAAGQLPVLLLCGEALVEAFVEAALGCTQVVIPVVDEAFFAAAAESASREETVRRGRRDERDRRDGDREERREPRAAAAEARPAETVIGEVEVTPGPGAAPSPLIAAPADLAGDEELDAAGDDDDDGEDDGEGEGDEPGELGAAEGSAPAASVDGRPAGDGRRRRRRRRRRGGRGRGERKEGGPAGEAAAGPGAEAAGGVAGGDGGNSPNPPAAPTAGGVDPGAGGT
jgi:hypothetical protein